MEVNELSGLIVDCAFQIHQQLGSGLLESVYEVLLAETLKKKGVSVARQVPISIEINGLFFNEGFRADLIVEEKVIVEVKSVQRLEPVFKKQLLTYLRLSGLNVGLLINFGGPLLKGNIERIVDGEAPDLHKTSEADFRTESRRSPED